jgi:hypothetical protein
MHNSHLLWQLRDEEDRARYALRRAERRMAREERRLVGELQAFDEGEARAEESIERQWRGEHYGREPDRAPAWRRRP